MCHNGSNKSKTFTHRNLWMCPCHGHSLNLALYNFCTYGWSYKPYGDRENQPYFKEPAKKLCLFQPTKASTIKVSGHKTAHQMIYYSDFGTIALLLNSHWKAFKLCREKAKHKIKVLSQSLSLRTKGLISNQFVDIWQILIKSVWNWKSSTTICWDLNWTTF